MIHLGEQLTFLDAIALLPESTTIRDRGDTNIPFLVSCHHMQSSVSFISIFRYIQASLTIFVYDSDMAAKVTK